METAYILGNFLWKSVFPFSTIEHVDNDIAESLQKVPLCEHDRHFIAESLQKGIARSNHIHKTWLLQTPITIDKPVLTGLDIIEVTRYKMAATRCNNTLRHHKIFLF